MKDGQSNKIFCSLQHHWLLQRTDKNIAHFTSALWFITLMWNDFFVDAVTNLKEKEIFLIEPVSTLLS